MKVSNLFNNIYSFSLGLAVVSLSFGDLAVYSIRISWVFMIITLFTLFLKFTFGSGIRISKKIHRIIFFCILWVFYALFLVVINSFHLIAMRGFISLLINIFLLVLILISIKSKKEILKLIFFIKVSLTVTLVFSLVNILYGIHFINVDPAHFRYTIYTPTSFFGNPNDVISVIVTCTYLLIFGAVIQKKFTFFDVILIMISIYIVIIADSRGGLLSLIILFSSYFFWYLIKPLLKNKTKLMYLISITVNILLLLFIFLPYTFVPLVMAFVSSEATSSGDFIRFQIMERSLTILKESYLFGVGPWMSTELMGINPHNFFLEILVDYGLFIFSIFTFLFFRILYSSIKENHYLMKVSILSISISFIILGISSSSIFRIRYTWVFLGLLLVISQLKVTKVLKDG